MEPFLVLFVMYIGAALLPTLIAGAYGRSVLGFFLLSVFFTPLLALILVLIMGKAPGPQQVIYLRDKDR